ncbi:MAG: hypothetical protein HY873_00095 [Chloroflexi bacterium]|nr:hypothetical protein [Chloroflexota bacterium]
MSTSTRGKRGRPRHPGVFTPAEWRVVDAIRAHETNARIAQELGVSVHTVRSHVSRILRKLGVSTRRDAAAALDGVSAPGGARCSFCLRPENDVAELLGGMAGARICGECVDIAARILAAHRASPS